MARANRKPNLATSSRANGTRSRPGQVVRGPAAGRKKNSRTKTSSRSARGRQPTPWWSKLPQEELLDLKLCDLKLSIAGTALEKRIERLYAELDRAGLRFRPYVWLSSDWFTPDGLTGFAVPFYLAHPRLARLEFKQMFEVEGGTADWCMKLLRHETGHALDNAYRLHRRKAWREVFGKFSEPYRMTYAPRPNSRDFVLNLSYWYSQSHPAEDYAESFAVWLQPKSRWRKLYKGWGALKKLEFLEEWLQQFADMPPLVKTRERPESLPQLRITLREYYRNKKGFYGAQNPTIYDRYLLRMFDRSGTQRKRESAAAFLRRNHVYLRNHVSSMTGQLRYAVDHALTEITARCRELDLKVVRSERETKLNAAILLTHLTVNLMRSRRNQYRR